MATSNAKKAAEERAKALNGRDERYIAALEVERHGYVVRGKDARVAEVDAEIAKYRKALGVRPGQKPTPPAPSEDIHVLAAEKAKAGPSAEAEVDAEAVPDSEE